MLKTKNEVIQGFLERHCSLLPEVNMKSYNAIKSQLRSIWENGFACGKDEAYHIGYQDGYDSHDENWKHNKELIDELKQQEYQLGLNDLWYAIRQLELSPADGALSVDEIEKIFGTSSVYSILQNVHPENVIDKIRAYEEQQKANGTNVLTNAQKFAEIFPNVVPFNDSSWWDEPYKEHDK